MKSSNLTMEDRLKKLYASLGLNVGAKSSNLAMIKSICAGFSIVEQNFDTVLNEIFADSSLNIGRQKMCELFDVTRFDKDVIKKFVSSKYDDYRLNELKNEFQKILDSFEIGFSSVFNMFIAMFSKICISSVKHFIYSIDCSLFFATISVTKLFFKS